MDLDDLVDALRPLDAVRMRAALERLLGRRVQGLLLYGSRARGEETTRSDWDVLAVTETSCEGVRRSWRGVDLDIDARSVEALAPSTDLVYLLPARVLYDTDGRLAHLLAELEVLREAGPAPLTEGERARWEAWTRRMLGRIDGNLADDLVLAAWQMSWLHQELLGLWFAWRRLWQRGPKRDMRWLREHEPAVWAAHEAVACASTLEARRVALGVVVDLTIV